MLGLLCVLLKYVHTRCDVSCDCSDSNAFSYSDCCNDPLDARVDLCDGKNRRNEITPMLCFSGGCPVTKDSCRPYLEFANVAVFIAKIPNGKKLMKLYNRGDIKGLSKFASQCGGCENYDVMSAFYYNADSRIGACNLTFDTNFIVWFLQRFYYYLDTILTQPDVCVSNTSIVTGGGRPIDLLCPPCTYTNLSFGSDANATALFNSIIGNSAIASNVTTFIQILLFQIQSANNACSSKSSGLGGNSTFSLYVDLLRQYLGKTNYLLGINADYTQKYAAQFTKGGFVWVPYPGKPGSPNGAALVNVPPTYFNDNTWTFLNSDA